ncbi:MAG: DUF3576 domain-containing protein [Rickettsiales bacterium]|jgi:hypothetical protein
MKKLLLALTSIFAFSACSNINSEAPSTTSAEEARKEARGKLTGDDGISFGGPKKNDASSASPLGVNSFLWRATLDTLSFMPLVSADPFGGVIITDWYEDPKAKGERYKVNALILDKTLRADGIKITLFKQSMDKNNLWRDQNSGTSDARKIEDTILTRAREFKINEGK